MNDINYHNLNAKDKRAVISWVRDANYQTLKGIVYSSLTDEEFKVLYH